MRKISKTHRFDVKLYEKALEKKARTGVSISFVLTRALEKWVGSKDESRV